MDEQEFHKGDKVTIHIGTKTEEAIVEAFLDPKYIISVSTGFHTDACVSVFPSDIELVRDEDSLFNIIYDDNV